MNVNKYTKEEAIKRIRENNSTIDDLCIKYNKQELISLYYAIYGNKPLSSYNKEDIATILRGYTHTIDRAKYLLEGIKL